MYKTNEANQQLAHVSGMDVYAKTNDKITFLLKKLVLSNAKEFIGVQETRYLMDIMERKYNELVKRASASAWSEQDCGYSSASRRGKYLN